MIIRDNDPLHDPALCPHEHMTTVGAGTVEVTKCFDCGSEWPRDKAPAPSEPHHQIIGRADTTITP